MQVTVIDTGHGISSEFLPCVFDRFRRGPIKINGDDGLGLGVAIARYLVEAHGGNICEHSSGFWRGSTFTVHLPFVAAGAITEMIAKTSVNTTW
jgi:signal transduction histidine kinase